MVTKSRPKAKVKHWQNRIVAHGDEPPENLLANPQNWRVHPAFQQEAMAATLDAIGFVQSVVVNQTTGHVIDGHLRVALAISRDEPSVPVSYVRLSPDEERLALATFDPLASLAVGDTELLGELLRDVKPFVESEALTKLLADLGDGAMLALGETPDLNDLVNEKAAEPGLTAGGGIKLDEVGTEITDQEPDALKALAGAVGHRRGSDLGDPLGEHPR